jgi:hypothetical protein
MKIVLFQNPGFCNYGKTLFAKRKDFIYFSLLTYDLVEKIKLFLGSESRSKENKDVPQNGWFD